MEGYKKVSTEREYDGGGFYFTKSLLCFQPCAEGTQEGGCTKDVRLDGDLDKCCVDKTPQLESSAKRVVAQQGDETDSCHLKWLDTCVGRTPLVDATRKDGLKVF